MFESQSRKPGSSHGTIGLCSVSVSEAEIRAVNAALLRGEVSGTGSDVTALEQSLARGVGRRHVIATNSGTSALDLALASLGLQAHDEVIVPSFTFAAPASAVVNAGAVPVLCDVDPDTWTISLAECEHLISKKTRAIIAVNVMGNPCDFDGLEKFGIPIIEDAAESIGAKLNDKESGSFGRLSVFSFHANKTVAAGEGGALLTDDDEIASRARLLINHGMSGGYKHAVAGRNWRMANLTAAFAVAQYGRRDQLGARRRSLFNLYSGHLKRLTSEPQRELPGARAAVWLAAFRSSDRDRLVQHIRSESIDARPVWPSLSKQPFLRPWTRRTPVAERLAAQGFWLPTHAELSDAEALRVVAAVKSYFGMAGAAS